MTEPLSDEQTMAQVVDAARQVVQAAGLREVTGGFVFESCNDQGAPPYRGRVDMSCAVPAGVEPEEHGRQIAADLVRAGWTAGAPAGKRPFGVVVHTETVMVVISSAQADRPRAAVQVCGQCRNMTDHRIDGKTVGVEISDRLGGSSPR
ncbi:MAG: hypothetical protein JO191_01205 [Mycobacteriaceae bacterium]|nr:hypothetical protein [Mycobacteriaceae bacterium]